MASWGGGGCATHCGSLAVFSPPPLLKRYLVYYILADLENKVRHLWWPNFLHPNPTLFISSANMCAATQSHWSHNAKFSASLLRKNGLILRHRYDNIIMGFYGKAFDNGLQAKAAGSKPILFPANQNSRRSGLYRS